MLTVTAAVPVVPAWPHVVASQPRARTVCAPSTPHDGRVPDALPETTGSVTDAVVPTRSKRTFGMPDVAETAMPPESEAPGVGAVSTVSGSTPAAATAASNRTRPLANPAGIARAVVPMIEAIFPGAVVGRSASRSAASPATRGAENDVPCQIE